MRRFGPVRDGETVLFRLWAPRASEVLLLRPDFEPLAMSPEADGFYQQSARVPDGQLYMFRADGLDVPDPASRGQEKDVEGWSRVVPAPGRPGKGAVRPWHEAIVAEVHVGAATPEGTFAALAQRLGHFAEAGYTAIELMPVADFAGRWNWGYDGVLPFAPDTSYGRPEDLRALVDAAHALGLGVILDVVYNHFGPSGNFLHHYAEDFFTDRWQTPWGAAIDLSNPLVRRFFVENAQMWLSDYDFDGLRLDAVHAFSPEGSDQLLREIAEAARAVKPDAWLILENDDNAARWLEREEGQPRHYTAQWNDDIHHGLHVAATNQTSGYYIDYADDPVAALCRALSEGFTFQGEPSTHRDGRSRGEASAHLPPDAFIAFLQNHDQVGNRPFGDRIVSSLERDKLAMLRFILMLMPQIPMFFMGEEASVTTPFPFFCDFHDELAEAVRAGRRREFAAFFEDRAGTVDDLPDPLARSTFESARLPWRELEEDGPALSQFKELARIRRESIWPVTASSHLRTRRWRRDNAMLVSWQFEQGTLTLAFNFGPSAISFQEGPDGPDHTVGNVSAREGQMRLDALSAAFWSVSA